MAQIAEEFGPATQGLGLWGDHWREDWGLGDPLPRGACEAGHFPPPSSPHHKALFTSFITLIAILFICLFIPYSIPIWSGMSVRSMTVGTTVVLGADAKPGTQ